MKNRFLLMADFQWMGMFFLIFTLGGCMMAPAMMNQKNPEKIFQAQMEDVYQASRVSLDNFGLKFIEEPRKEKGPLTITSQLTGGGELVIYIQPLGENLTKVTASTGYFKDDKVLIQGLFDNIDQKLKTINSND